MNKMCILFAMVLVLRANPIWIEVINEFQVAPYDSERVELRYLESSTPDTIFTGAFELYNTPIVTPSGVAYVDSNVFLVGMGQTVIDRSVLTGVFELPDDTGYIAVHSAGFLGGDSIFYPGHATTWCCAPAPPYYCSAAKFHCYAYSWFEYFLISDWYIDSTPTFGAPNDDYPGCIVSGCVYDNYSQPISGARVTATFADLPSVIFPPQPYQVCCTTFTAVNGFYYFDSLLPYAYYVDVNVNGYLPDTQYAGGLCCTDPITNLDFYLQTGITEDEERRIVAGPFVHPNPFHSVLHITLHEPSKHVDIYDVTGELMQRIDNQHLSTDLTVDCVDLPRGIYFVVLRDQRLKVIKL